MLVSSAKDTATGFNITCLIEASEGVSLITVFVPDRQHKSFSPTWLGTRD